MGYEGLRQAPEGASRARCRLWTQRSQLNLLRWVCWVDRGLARSAPRGLTLTTRASGDFLDFLVVMAVNFRGQQLAGYLSFSLHSLFGHA